MDGFFGTVCCRDEGCSDGGLDGVSVGVGWEGRLELLHGVSGMVGRAGEGRLEVRVRSAVELGFWVIDRENDLGRR